MKKKLFPSSLFLMALIYSAFVALGLPDGLIGVAWPSIRANFKLHIDSLGLLLIACTIGYLVSSFFSGRLMAKLKVGVLLSLSCGLTGLVLIGYCIVPSWFLMILLGIFAGLGAGAIDAGLNTYVAENFSERRMQWLHASYGIGVTLGPLIMTYAINFLGNWRIGYIVGGIAQLSLAICFLFSAQKWENVKPMHPSSINKNLSRLNTPIKKTLSELSVWKSLVLFFLYSGAEATLGIWAYTILTVSRGIKPAIAGIWAGSYWGTFTIGRILAGFFVKRLKNRTLVLSSLTLALSGAILFWSNFSGYLSLMGVVVIGFAIAPLFPAFVSTTKNRVGEIHFRNTIGMQMSFAGLGSAFVTSFAGVLAKHFSPEIIPLYLFCLFILILILFLTFPNRGFANKRLKV